MIEYILSGMLLGIALTLTLTYAFIFIARRKCWLDVRIAPSPGARVDTAERLAIDRLSDEVDRLSDDLSHLITEVGTLLDNQPRAPVHAQGDIALLRREAE